MVTKKPVKITETVLRDGHQSLVATRMRIEDMLPVLSALDKIGYNALEAWGGATFDTCLRFLGEDPWERLPSCQVPIGIQGPREAGLFLGRGGQGGLRPHRGP